MHSGNSEMRNADCSREERLSLVASGFTRTCLRAFLAEPGRESMVSAEVWSLLLSGFDVKGEGLADTGSSSKAFLTPAFLERTRASTESGMLCPMPIY